MICILERWGSITLLEQLKQTPSFQYKKFVILVIGDAPVDYQFRRHYLNFFSDHQNSRPSFLNVGDFSPNPIFILSSLLQH